MKHLFKEDNRLFDPLNMGDKDEPCVLITARHPFAVQLLITMRQAVSDAEPTVGNRLLVEKIEEHINLVRQWQTKNGTTMPVVLDEPIVKQILMSSYEVRENIQRMRADMRLLKEENNKLKKDQSYPECVENLVEYISGRIRGEKYTKLETLFMKIEDNPELKKRISDQGLTVSPGKTIESCFLQAGQAAVHIENYEKLINFLTEMEEKNEDAGSEASEHKQP